LTPFPEKIRFADIFKEVKTLKRVLCSLKHLRGADVSYSFPEKATLFPYWENCRKTSDENAQLKMHSIFTDFSWIDTRACQNFFPSRFREDEVSHGTKSHFGRDYHPKVGTQAVVCCRGNFQVRLFLKIYHGDSRGNPLDLLFLFFDFFSFSRKKKKKTIKQILLNGGNFGKKSRHLRKKIKKPLDKRVKMCV